MQRPQASVRFLSSSRVKSAVDVGSGSSEVRGSPYQPGVSFEIFRNGSAAARMRWKPETSLSVGVPTLDEFAG